jgi:hypothetical protein
MVGIKKLMTGGKTPREYKKHEGRKNYNKHADLSNTQIKRRREGTDV